MFRELLKFVYQVTSLVKGTTVGFRIILEIADLWFADVRPSKK